MLRALTRYPMDRRKFDDVIAEVASGERFVVNTTVYDFVAPPSISVCVFSYDGKGSRVVTVPLTQAGL